MSKLFSLLTFGLQMVWKSLQVDEHLQSKEEPHKPVKTRQIKPLVMPYFVENTNITSDACIIRYLNTKKWVEKLRPAWSRFFFQPTSRCLDI